MVELFAHAMRRVSRIAAIVGVLATAACGTDGQAPSAAAPAAQSQRDLLKEPLLGLLPKPITIAIGALLRLPIQIDTIETRSGRWFLSDLGATGDIRVYLWQLDRNPDFVRLMACRRAYTTEEGDNATLLSKLATFKLVERGKTVSWLMGVAQGSCRIMQNMEPVAPNADWLREAVAENRIPAYDRDRAWLPGLTTLARDPQRGAYNAASLGPIPGSTATPTSTLNFVGVTSSQGGEYESSRGFLHNADARVVDAALHNEDAAIAAFMPEFTQYTFYSLAQPQAAVWSTVNHITADPQFPMPGDRAYEIANAASRRRPDIDSLIPTDGWRRDESHLENTGYVHWILTEDPVAGMLVQRQLAFHLANFFEADRGVLPSYYIQTQQERGIYNALSALWKARDVARRVSSVNGTVIWDAERVEKMAREGIASIDAQVKTWPARDVAAATGAVLSPIYGAGEWKRRDGTPVFYPLESNFQGVQYGKEPLWLWTKDGDPTVTGWMRAKTRQAVARALYIGGALGIDRAEDVAGSSLPLGPSVMDANGLPMPAPTPFANEIEWARWLIGQPLAEQPRDNFDEASIHTVEQMEGLLLFAKDAGLNIPGTDAALAKMRADRARTTRYRFESLQMVKHLGGPPA